jgi:hypothetical protein
MRVTGVAKVVLLLLGAIPAGIGIAAGHEVVGIVLSAIGEAFVLVTAFAAGIVKEVSTRWRTRLADRLDSLIISWTSQFGKKYHEYVLASLRLMEEEGPATTGFYRPELDETSTTCSCWRPEIPRRTRGSANSSGRRIPWWVSGPGTRSRSSVG